MAKKRSKRESSSNQNNTSSSKCKSNKKNNNSKSNESKKLADFSYAELVILSATLSYSLSEELDEDDLTIFIVFLGLLLSEMELLVAQRSLKNRSQSNNIEDEDINLDEDD